MKNLILTLLLFGANSTFIAAHVGLDHPVGGESFTAGDTLTIKWSIVIPHDQDNWDLYYSIDAGTSWTPIELDIPPSQLEYHWKIPAQATKQGMIKITQDNKLQDYEAVSSNFTINEIAATQLSTSLFVEQFSQYPNPFKESVNFEFHLSQKETVTIEIMSLDFSWHTIILNKMVNEGDFIQKWAANGLPSGFYNYRFCAGTYIKTGKLMLIR